MIRTLNKFLLYLRARNFDWSYISIQESTISNYKFQGTLYFRIYRRFKNNDFQLEDKEHEDK